MAGAPPVEGRHRQRLGGAWHAWRAGGQCRIEAMRRSLDVSEMPGGRRRARVDLEGNVAGEVSREQRCRAERLVARIKARQLAEAAAAEAEAESERAVRRAALPPSIINGKVVIMPPPPEMTPPTGSGRLGLPELKRAAMERRARQDAKCR